jgi:6,7-dimethyl-8-ribityllumazine synthase
MTSGGFWPGESPAAEHEETQDAEAAVVETESSKEPPAWPGSPQQKPEQQAEPESAPEPAEAEAEAEAEAQPEPEPEAEPEAEPDEEEQPQEPAPAAHVPGEIDIPEGVAVLEGAPSGAERTVGVVVSRFNGEISNRLLGSALGALAEAGVPEERITVMPVPGAFELPIGAMALAKTRRYSCVVALGCVVRGETAHFEYVAGEAASGLQLAGLETGVPVAFGVLTVDTAEQAEARLDKGADAARAALEMADLFSQVRQQARA